MSLTEINSFSIRNLPDKLQEFAQLHCGATTVAKLWVAVRSYHVRMRMTGTLIVYMQQWDQSPELLEMSHATIVGAKVTMHVTAQILQSVRTVGRVAILQKIVDRKIHPRSRHQGSSSVKSSSRTKSEGQACSSGQGHGRRSWKRR